jgi:phosphatidylserine synthase
MVSPFRFPSFKHFRSRAARVLYFGAMAGGVTMLVVGQPGGTVLLGFLVVYLLSALAGPGGRYDADAK